MGFLHEHIILPLSDLLRGEQVHKYLRQLCEAERWTPEQMQAFQQERLRKLIVYASKEVPYYRDWIQTNQVNPESTPLEQLPIIDKKIIQKEGLIRFCSESFPKKEKIISSTSGSTGQPFIYYTSRLADSVNTAAKLRTWYNAGYRLGDPYVKIAYRTRPIIKKLQDKLNNCTYLIFKSPANDDMECLLHEVAAAKPKVIRAHANIAYYLALTQLRLKLNVSPHLVMTTATNLTQKYRETIKLAFECDVIDSYSCEGTPNTAETPRHDGYYISKAYGIIETLDDNGNPINNGIGRVIATDLWNYAQPFIRYDTLDLVELEDGKIKRIIGRSNEYLLCDDGKKVTGYAIGEYFKHIQKNITFYQFYCRKDGSIELRLVAGKDFKNSQIDEIKEYWNNTTHKEIRICMLEYIPTSTNGKQKTIINE